MRTIIHTLAFVLLFISCKAQEIPTEFSEKALADKFLTLNGDTLPFSEILKKHDGKTILIDVWASWCKDCINGMPKVKALQAETNDVEYVFLSLDKSVDSWKAGIEKYNVKGDHYFMQSGWKGDFGTFLNLDWIPRYIVVDGNGKIKVYKAIEVDDEKISQNLSI